MSVNLTEINHKLQQFATTLPAGLVRDIQQKLVLDVLAGVIRRTPVDTGVARGGWQVSLDMPVPTPTTTERGTLGDFAGPAFERGAAQAARIRPYSIAYILNAVPHAQVLDQGGFVPQDPSDDPEAKRKRAQRRSPLDRQRALLMVGDEGGALVVGGYAFQAPAGMTQLTLQEVAAELPSP